jgi:hypothetical protein
MEHPFIHDLDNQSLEDLGKRISELYRKLGIAQRAGNGYLCDQIRMALESYQIKHQEKLQELYNPKTGDGPDFNSKIDIS